MFMNLLPSILMGMLLSIFTYKIAQKTNANKSLYVLFTLIPGIGIIFFIYVLLASILMLLDQINYLKSEIQVTSDLKNEV